MAITDLQDILDRTAIEELRSHYAHALDHKDWDALHTLFTDDVQTDFSDFGLSPQTVFRQAFIDSFKTNLSRPGLATQHVFSNFRITVQEGHATSVSHFTGHHFLAGADGGEEFTIRAEYTDMLIKTTEGWRIRGVACKLFFMTGNPGLLGW